MESTFRSQHIHVHAYGSASEEVTERYFWQKYHAVLIDHDYVILKNIKRLGKTQTS
jgi:glycerophosphoryl diester phosphodiesterase